MEKHTVNFNQLKYRFLGEEDYQKAKEMLANANGDVIEFESLLDSEDIFYQISVNRWW